MKGWTSTHGLLRYLVGLHEVGVFEALRIGGLPARTPKLMEGDRDLLLLFTLARGPHTDAVLTFSILNEAGDTVGNGSLSLGSLCDKVCSGWGRFRFGGLTPGNYTIRLDRNGQPAAEATFTVTG